MGNDVCVNNSYGHCTVSCFGFRRRSESKPKGGRREIVRKSYGLRRLLSGNRTEPVQCP